MIRMSNLNKQETNVRSKYKDKDFFDACIKGDKDAFIAILESGFSITDTKTTDGKTVIHLAAIHNQKEIMKILIDKKVDIDTVDDNNNTALLLACIECHKEMISLLLNSLANVNIQDNLGNTPAIAIFYHPKNASDCLIQLLDRKAQIDIKNSRGTTVLLNAITSGELDCVKLLLERGANILDRDNNGRTALHLAVINNNQTIIKYVLLEHSHLVGIQDHNGYSSLQICCYIGYTIGLKLLLQHPYYSVEKEHLELMDGDGWTPLMSASIRSHAAMIPLLLDAGSNTEASIRGDGYTCCLIAAFCGNSDVVKALLSRGALKSIVIRGGIVNVACCALERKGANSDFIIWLLEQYPELVKERVYDIKLSLLNCAAMHGNVEVVKYLLDRNEDIEYKPHDSSGTPNSGHPPLTNSCFGGHMECVKYLLSRGADIENGDCDATNPLMAAAYSGETEVMRFLLDYGADIEHRETNGLSALTAAADKNHMDCVNLLLDRGLRPERGKFDEKLIQNPDWLFKNTLLTLCKSPVSVLNRLYESNRTSEQVTKSIQDIVRSLLITNDPQTLMRIVTFINSISSAANVNRLEEEDLLERLKQSEALLTEIFRSNSLDLMENVLQLLLPTISFQEYEKYDMEKIKEMGNALYELIRIEQEQSEFRRLHFAHCLNGHVLEYCMTNNLKIIFQYPQVANIISETFYNTRSPSKNKLLIGSKNELYYYGRSNLFDYFNDFIVYYTAFNDLEGYEKTKLFETLDMLCNMRYNPMAVFLLDAVSRIIILSLITYILINNGYQSTQSLYTNYLSHGYVVAFVFSHFLHEIGELIETGFSSEYFDDWNKLDSISACLLIIWMSIKWYFNSSPTAHIVLCISAIPISLGLLRFISVNKSVGQLLIMFRAMTIDVLSFFILYLVCTLGFAVTLSGLYSATFDANNDDSVRGSYSILTYSFLSLYSATLGNFQFPYQQEANSSTINSIETFLLIVYLLGSTVMLLNLLIARMSNTHQKINDNSQREWTFLFAKNCKQFSLLKEVSPLSMLPAPLNIITIGVFPLHQYYIWKMKRNGDDDGISIAGTVADRIVLFFGEFLSIFYFSYTIVKRSYYVLKKIRKEKNYMKFIALFSFPIWLPIFVVVHFIKRFIDMGFVQIHDDFTFVGLECHVLKEKSDAINNDDVSLNPLISQQLENDIKKDSFKAMRIGEIAEKDDYIPKVRNIFTSNDIERILRTVQNQERSDSIKDYIDQKFSKLENSIKELQNLILNSKAIDS